tara:strand:- start:1428 stop:2174 length:747 start_codon:yes stop_codon:yes gene_type:complete
MAHICKDGTRQITKNFNEKELYSKSLDAPECHFLDDRVINGLQIIRDHFNAPIRVTSTMRTPLGNDLVDGVDNSRHLPPNARAIDSQFIQNPDLYLQQFYDDFKCKGPLYRKLRANGINGIGIYKTFIHIDTRSTSQKSFWDDSAGKYGDVRVTNAYMAEVPETGLDSSACAFESEAIAEETDSDYGLTGALAPLDPRNYSGEDGIKSQEQGLTRLVILGSVLLILGGFFIINSSRKKRNFGNIETPL